MNTDDTYKPQVQDDSEEAEKHLALLIHQAGEDARVHTKKILDEHFKKLNDMIAEAVLSQKIPPIMTDAQNPRLIVVAGPNGSGKTTITEKLLRHEWMEDCQYINPDLIAQQEFGDWNSPAAVIQAANKAKATRDYCLAHNISIAFETVFSTQEKLEFLKRAKDAGFFIRFFFVCTNDPSINAQRVAKRVMGGGHDVPIPKIIDRYYRSISNALQAMKLADRAYFYDNTEINTDPLLLFRVKEGEIEKTYSDISPWAKIIYDSLEKEE